MIVEVMKKSRWIGTYFGDRANTTCSYIECWLWEKIFSMTNWMDSSATY